MPVLMKVSTKTVLHKMTLTVGIDLTVSLIIINLCLSFAINC